jgi:DNA-directed RNA polymerase II subunit RPB2
MNPHAIPSRMTIGMLLEMILGKASASLCGYSDCTPFTNINYDTICDILEANGFSYTGDEILYSGITGQQMDVKLFMGPTYYQRLKHMVSDKLHSRGSGPVVQLTRQPAEGRSRDGGLRFGKLHFAKDRGLITRNIS